MAKNAVSDWDTTAGNNTDVGGINIAEGCAPANINNAMREKMAQIATLYADLMRLAGTQTVTGDKTFTGTVDLSGATLSSNNAWSGDNTFTGDVDVSAATVIGLYDRPAVQNTTSGTAFLFSGIPTWANEVRLMLNRVSLNADGEFLTLQIGNGSLVTSGYFARAEVGDGTTGLTPTTNFPIASVQAANTCTGTMTLTRSEGNVWLAEGHFFVAGNVWHSVGILGLAGALDRVQLSRSGSATFDGGSVAASWRA